MAYIIANNLFTRDTRATRGTRLSQVSSHIDRHAAELEIEAALLAWAQGASAAYDDALVAQTNKTGEKGAAFGASQNADAAMLERYVQLRKLLKSRYGDDKLTLREYGISGTVPQNNQQRYYKAIELIEKNAERLAAGDPRALPAGMVASLVPLADDVETEYKLALEAGRIANNTTKALNVLFDADSVRLRILYNWCVSYWGKRNPLLIDLGFVQAKTHHRGQPKPPENLSYDDLNSVFSWDAVERATSYQCEMKTDSSGVNSLGVNSLGVNSLSTKWNEIYEGAGNSFTWQVVAGSWDVRVRARNAHGFGKWGDEIEINV